MDAVWDGEWVSQGMGTLDEWTLSKGKGQFGGNVGHPIVTFGYFVA